jgi:enoyl-CoA hydratase/carnithine racemase
MELKATRYHVDGGIAVCTLHRPDRFNAMTNRMMTEYRWVLRAADLMSETLRYGQAIAADTAPSSTRVIKAQLNADLVGTLDASARRSVDLMHEMLGSPDFKEGIAALREKRPPRFDPG